MGCSIKPSQNYQCSIANKRENIVWLHRTRVLHAQVPSCPPRRTFTRRSVAAVEQGKFFFSLPEFHFLPPWRRDDENRRLAFERGLIKNVLFVFSTKCSCTNNEWSKCAPLTQRESQEVSVLHITAISTLSQVITYELPVCAKIESGLFLSDGNKGYGNVSKALIYVTMLEFDRGKEFA